MIWVVKNECNYVALVLEIRTQNLLKARVGFLMESPVVSYALTVAEFHLIL